MDQPLFDQISEIGDLYLCARKRANLHCAHGIDIPPIEDSGYAGGLERRSRLLQFWQVFSKLRGR